jgi:FMNH2-dependent dimethyl sulfone monooxygenase
VITQALLIIRETEQEAERDFAALIEQGDYQGAQNVMDVLGIESESFTEQSRGAMQRGFIAGFGMPIVKGTPEQAGEQLPQLSDAGVDAVFFGLIDYAAELEFLGARLLPLLVQAGLREG